MKSKLVIPVCLLLVLIILILGMTTASFSWFEPDVKEGVGLQFNDEANLRAENCSLETFLGTKDDNTNVINYADTKLSSANATVSASNIAYYKTVIKNNNTDKDTVVSLYLKNFNVSANGSASLGVAIPTNSYRTFTSATPDLHIVRNAYISYQVQNEDRSGELVVEWFVKCDEGSVSFNPGDLYIMYS